MTPNRQAVGKAFKRDAKAVQVTSRCLVARELECTTVPDCCAAHVARRKSDVQARGSGQGLHGSERVFSTLLDDSCLKGTAPEVWQPCCAPDQVFCKRTLNPKSLTL